MIVGIDTNCILPGKVGGIENYTISLIEALISDIARSDEIAGLVLLCRGENLQLFSQYRAPKCTVIPVPRPQVDGTAIANWSELEQSNPKLCARLSREFAAIKRKLVRDLQIDVLHFPGNTINPLDVGVPTVLTLHDLQHEHFPQYFTTQELENRRRWWHESARCADIVVTGTRHGASDLQRRLSLDPKRIAVAPYTTQAKFFESIDEAASEQVRHRLSISRRYFLYPAAGWEHKNHEFLFRAFEASELEDVQLVCAGHGLDAPHIRRALDQCNASVRIVERLSALELQALYRNALALVFPSLYEGWGIPVTEAMCCRCPVLAANRTALPEVVGDAGVLFDPTNVDELARLMRSIAQSDSLRNVLRREGLERVTNLAPAHFARRMIEVYREAIDLHGAERLRKAS